MKIKDPIHGYIEIDKETVHNIVDTCEFQRLREIRQTNYNGLYPSSLHNRFTHSLGVYYLGKIVVDKFLDNLEETYKETHKDGYTKIYEKDLVELNRYKETFIYACLLHDVGHAPFSHSCEMYYKDYIEENKYKLVEGQNICSLYNRLYEEVCDNQKYKRDDYRNPFYEDYRKIINSDEIFKPHEAMSVIISLKKFNKFLEEKINFELFARMILGCINSSSDTILIGVQNCLIKMLNSKIIDVDKLDYLLRDTKMTGFHTSSIDIDRLLESFCLVEGSDCKYYLGYKKNILSTLVNVVICLDSEKKWIQSHPIIKYETYLFEKCVNELKNNAKEIFTEKALTENGVMLSSGEKIRLLSDADVLYFIKKINTSESFVTEYFSRKDRKKPLWKTEVEFNLIFSSLSEEVRKDVIQLFLTNNGNNLFDDTLNLSFIDDNLIKRFNDEIHKIDNETSMELKKKKLKKYLFWCLKLKEFCDSNSIKFEIVNIEVKNFSSAFENLLKENPRIKFTSFKKARTIAEIDEVYTLSEKNNTGGKYFYLYFERKNDVELSKLFVEFLRKAAAEYQETFDI